MFTLEQEAYNSLIWNSLEGKNVTFIEVRGALCF